MLGNNETAESSKYDKSGIWITESSITELKQHKSRRASIKPT